MNAHWSEFKVSNLLTHLFILTSLFGILHYDKRNIRASAFLLSSVHLGVLIHSWLNMDNYKFASSCFSSFYLVKNKYFLKFSHCLGWEFHHATCHKYLLFLD